MNTNLVLDQELLERSTPIGLNEIPGFLAHRVPVGHPLSCVREVHLYGEPLTTRRHFPIVEHRDQANLLELHNMRVHALMAHGDSALFILQRTCHNHAGHVLVEIVTDPGVANVFLLVHC